MAGAKLTQNPKPTKIFESFWCYYFTLFPSYVTGMAGAKPSTPYTSAVSITGALWIFYLIIHASRWLSTHRCIYCVPLHHGVPRPDLSVYPGVANDSVIATRSITHSSTPTPRLASTCSYVSWTHALCHGSIQTDVAQPGPALTSASPKYFFHRRDHRGHLHPRRLRSHRHHLYSSTWTT
jgi:hypothetical protein